MEYFPEIKICGITNLKDAELAIKFKADIIGFIFAESPRKIDAEKAWEISKKLKNIKSAGVFVNEKPEVINSIIRKLKLNFVQLCGEEKIKDIKKIKSAKIIKVIRPENEKDLKDKLKKYKNYADYFLLDTYKKGIYGRTGEKFNWDLIKTVKKIKKPYFVAGGINPENVYELLVKYKPSGIDVNSGIEKSYGKKSKKKIKLLFDEISKAVKIINKEY